VYAPLGETRPEGSLPSKLGTPAGGASTKATAPGRFVSRAGAGAFQFAAVVMFSIVPGEVLARKQNNTVFLRRFAAADGRKAVRESGKSRIFGGFSTGRAAKAAFSLVFPLFLLAFR